MINYTDIVNAVISLVTVLITRFLIPLIKSKFDAEQLAKAQKYVNIAVEAAEQIYNASGLGEAKKAYVQKWLDDCGIKLDADVLDAMIESAVHALTTTNT